MLFRFIEFLRTAKAHGVEIVVSSQVLRGAVELGVYETGSELKKLGLIDGCDMTIEACVTKLAYLMGKGLKSDDLKQAFESDLRGEVSRRDHKQAIGASVTAKL